MSHSSANSKTIALNNKDSLLNHHSSAMTKIQSAARALILTKMIHINEGCVTLVEQFEASEGMHSQTFGDENAPHVVTVEVHHPDFYRRMLTGGSIAAAEAFMEGWWSTPDLTQLLTLMAKNLSTLDSLSKKSSWVKRAAYQLAHWRSRNTLSNSKKNIHAHYDLGNELYELFLDSEMLYSSAIYEHESDTLEQAQLNKMERLCQQLELSADDHVIEIGTGWGAMAIYMATHYGCKVTTTTISKEQFTHTKQRVEALGLQDRITLLDQDYRDLEGQYDKLVSIEMIEAVGKSYLRSYVEKCNALLKPGGKMAIQAITIADQRYDFYSNSVDFIQKYIFPGGFLPSTTSLLATTTEHSRLVLRDLYDIGEDYARTLADWHTRFEAALPLVRAQGFDERFIRMWRYYLAYCEGGFKAKTISTVQLTFEKAAA